MTEEIMREEKAEIARPETAADVLAAQARAVVQARYQVAMARPRDWDEVRQRLLRECDRSAFARAARYAKPVGRTSVTGFSIRFAEAALRIMTNILPEAQVIFDDDARRIVRVTVTDLEANLTYSKDVLLGKTVERSAVREGQEVLGHRINSYGKAVYLVRATEDDLAVKEGAAVSKVIRQNGLRLIPGDLLEECEMRAAATVRKEIETDPDAARKRLVDGFGALGVRPADLRSFAGAGLDALSPAELAALRDVYQAIRDGETNWREVMEQRTKARGDEAAAKAGVSKTTRLKEQLGVAEAAASGGSAPQRGTAAAAAQHPAAAAPAPLQFAAGDDDLPDF